MEKGIQEIIRRSVDDVWRMFLNLDIQPAEPHASTGPRVSGILPIHGQYEWTVALDCSVGFARRSAAAMFGTAPESLSMDDMQDALSELANMTAGYVKTGLPPPCDLALPVVPRGSQPFEGLGAELGALDFV